MKPWTATLTLVLAAGLAVAAVYATRPVPREVALFSDQGSLLVEGLADPLTIKSLEVFSFSRQTSRVQAFKVAFDGTRWTIPSHSNYPADAASKVAAAAATFANLVKERVASDDKRDHARLGVLAPDDQTLSPDGVGTRVRLAEGSGKTIADLIIGTAIAADGTPMPESVAAAKRYVRHADSNRVYATTFAAGFSTRFADWVQVDLLQLTQDQPTGVFIDRYKIDAQTGTLAPVSQLTLTRAATPDETGARPWLMTGGAGGGGGAAEAADPARMNEVLAALSGLKIVGVRPKPANLARVLATPDKGFKLGLTDQLSLQSRGFFITADGRFVASEGQMSVQTAEGITYTLWFGEGVPDTEDAASGGRVGAEAAGAPETTAGPSSTGTARYLMVTAAFDPGLLPEPARPATLIELEAQAATAAETPAEPAATPPAEGAAAEAKPAPGAAPAVDAAALEAARNEHAAKVEVWKGQVEAGRKKAEQLAKRFSDWYYVIDAPSLGTLRPERADLVKPAPVAAPPVLPTPAQP